MARRKKLDGLFCLMAPPGPLASMLGLVCPWPAHVSCNFDTGGKGGRWRLRDAAMRFISLEELHLVAKGIPAFLSWPRTHPHARWSCAKAASISSMSDLLTPPLGPQPSVCRPAPRVFETGGYELWLYFALGWDACTRILSQGACASNVPHRRPACTEDAGSPMSWHACPQDPVSRRLRVRCPVWAPCVDGRCRVMTGARPSRGGSHRPRSALAAANSVSDRRPSACHRMSSVRRPQSSSRAGNGKADGVNTDGAAPLELLGKEGAARCTVTTGRAACT